MQSVFSEHFLYPFVKRYACDTMNATPMMHSSEQNTWDGLLKCSRYAFGPNRLHYCGPDASSEIAAHITHKESDPALAKLLSQFQTMYPYLKKIAEANRIANPFDVRVVEAYWIGNELLENVEKKDFYEHLVDDHKIDKRIGKKSFSYVADKIGKGAVLHHSFHVLDIWKRTGHVARPHTVESMASCIISWGEVKKADGMFLEVETESLVYEVGKLAFGVPTMQRIARGLGAPIDIDEAKAGDIITMHWGVPCEVITRANAAVLKKYTLRHIALANETI